MQKHFFSTTAPDPSRLSTKGKKDVVGAALGTAGLFVGAFLIVKNLASPFHPPMMLFSSALGAVYGFKRGLRDFKKALGSGSADNLASAMSHLTISTAVGITFGYASAELCDSAWINASKEPAFTPTALGSGLGLLWGLKKQRSGKKFFLKAALGFSLGFLAALGLFYEKETLTKFEEAARMVSSWTHSEQRTEKQTPFLSPRFESGSTAQVIRCESEPPGQTFIFRTDRDEFSLSCANPDPDTPPKIYDFRGTKGTGVLLFDVDGAFRTLKFD